ncbi:GrpB family protein [Nesterenkonia muleiensis]|uniref:GrpB family protein n=1 Tax=Nesterenkonia muleiensis TaxID=2282648 RepID=UPI00130060F1
MYVCVEGSLHLRNHLAVRDVLRRRSDLRDRYGAVKFELSRVPSIGMDAYLAGKSVVLQEVLEYSDLTKNERASIRGLNERS